MKKNSLRRTSPHTLAYHPTKGYRRISDRRYNAMTLMNAMLYIAGIRAKGRRNLAGAYA